MAPHTKKIGMQYTMRISLPDGHVICVRLGENQAEAAIYAKVITALIGWSGDMNYYFCGSLAMMFDLLPEPVRNDVLGQLEGYRPKKSGRAFPEAYLDVLFDKGADKRTLKRAENAIASFLETVGGPNFYTADINRLRGELDSDTGTADKDKAFVSGYLDWWATLRDMTQITPEPAGAVPEATSI